jgi:hypothetical protein
LFNCFNRIDTKSTLLRESFVWTESRRSQFSRFESESIMSFQFFSIDHAAANASCRCSLFERSQREHDVAINFSFLLSTNDMMSFFFFFSLSMKFSMLKIESCLIRSWNEHDVYRKSLIREQLQLCSCVFELVWDLFVCAKLIEIRVQFVRYLVAFSANYQRHVFDSHSISRMRL